MYESYWQQALSFLGTPEGFLAFLMMLAVLAAILVKPQLRWHVLAFVLVSTTFGGGDESTIDFGGVRSLPWPLSFLANNARLITTFSAASLLMASITANRGWRPKAVGFGALCFLALYLWIAFRATFDPTTLGRGILGLVSCTIFFTVLAVGLGRWLQTLDDAYHLLGSIATAGFLFVVANLYLLILHPSAGGTGRFSGTTANPQFMGIDCVLLLPTVLFLIERGTLSKFRRIALLATAGFLIIFLLWTGSRTGMLGAVTAVLVLYQWRIHRFLPMAVVVGLAVYMAIWFFPDSLAHLNRFTDPTNSRATSYDALWNAFLWSPIIGNGHAAHAESMYLSVLAGYGIVGGIPLLALILHTLSSAISAVRSRHVFGRDGRLVDLVLANLAIIPVIGLFEETLIGIFNPLSLFFYLNLALLTFLVLAAHHPAEALASTPAALESPLLESASAGHVPA